MRDQLTPEQMEALKQRGQVVMQAALALGLSPVSVAFRVERGLDGIKQTPACTHTYRQALVQAVASGVASGLSPRGGGEHLAQQARLVTDFVNMVLQCEAAFHMDNGLPLPIPTAEEGLVK